MKNNYSSPSFDLRIVGNTSEVDRILTTIEHDLTNPIYTDDFDHQRAEQDLQSILDGQMIDAFNWRIEGKTVHIPNSGYGCIMAEQLPNVVELLNSDEDSRQASVVFWNGQGTPSCTLTADFKIRNGVLNAVFFQRSTCLQQLPYDLYNFTGITRWVGERVEADLGTLVLVTASLHQYN